jgi:LmbE family N-acetylglucosaminyl deacetylase
MVAVTDAVTSRAIAGAGTPEDLWLDWLARRQTVPVRLDDIVAIDARLVVLAPHPDDEVLACGALLSMHVERGGAALIVAATDGEASHAGCAGWEPAQLARQRHKEREAGLGLLGLSTTPLLRLRLPDGRLHECEARLEHGLVDAIQADDVLLSTWRLDGHPDHEACGRRAAHVASRTGCRLVEAPVWMWHWAQPNDPRVPWHRLRSLHVDAGTRARKATALAAHASQLTPRAAAKATPSAEPVAVLGPAILARNRRAAEYYIV